MKKSPIDNKIYDVLNMSEYEENRQFLDNSYALEKDGYVYPIRTNPSDTRPGFYTEGTKTVGFFKDPQTEMDKETYSSANIIDFGSKDMKTIIERSEELQEKEREILVAPGNIYKATASPEDTPEMAALKEGLTLKKCDPDNYGYLFGENWANDKRLLSKHKISSDKFKTFIKNFDMKVTMIVEDANPNVPNPIGQKLVYVIAGDDEGGNNE